MRSRLEHDKKLTISRIGLFDRAMPTVPSTKAISENSDGKSGNEEPPLPTSSGLNACVLPNFTSPVWAIKPSITLWNTTPSYAPELTKVFILSTCKGAKSGSSVISIFPLASPATSITRLFSAKAHLKINIKKYINKNFFRKKISKHF